jgi:hypothetical protein
MLIHCWILLDFSLWIISYKSLHCCHHFSVLFDVIQKFWNQLLKPLLNEQTFNYIHKSDCLHLEWSLLNWAWNSVTFVKINEKGRKWPFVVNWTIRWLLLTYTNSLYVEERTDSFTVSPAFSTTLVQTVASPVPVREKRALLRRDLRFVHFLYVVFTI